MSFLDDLYYMPIKATTVYKKEKRSKKDVSHDVMASQSSDYWFTLSDGIDMDTASGYVVSVSIPPENLETLKQHVDKAVENYKNKVKKE